MWAPHAKGVRVKGDFNSWDGREHPMRQLGVSGVWELFVPDVASGAHYKFVVLGADDEWREKADPMAFHTEVPPATVVGRVRVDVHLERRRLDAPERAAGAAHEKPMSAYEVHLGSWRRGRSYAELADELVPYLAGDRLHARRAAAGDGAPVRRLVGLPGHVVLRADARFGDPDGLR